jgi:hypothetical protein
MTVILSSEMLRGRGAAISKALSWDKTIEDVVKEFESGLSSQDLARCRRVVINFGAEGAACFTRGTLGVGIEEAGAGGVPKPPPGLVTDSARLERFVYDTELHEGAWKANHPGDTFGAVSILTACMVRHELDPTDFPVFVAVGRALSAIRENHLQGGGATTEFGPEKIPETLGRKMNPAANDNQKEEPAKRFRAAFPHKALADEVLNAQKPRESDLLRDLTGAGIDYVAAFAADVVLRGPEEALKSAPKAKYGNYFLTVDREEIERINSISNLIRTYLGNPEDRRPLSLAVFGRPGSGKSFAIKELASDLFGHERAVLEFNLSQFDESGGDLHAAFHLVRDAAVHGKIPLVFWDEFDTDNLKWLKYFLSPMSDAKFRAANILHPFGKAIFVFAGGTAFTFEEFSRRAQKISSSDVLKDEKGPGFVSWLRGEELSKAGQKTNDSKNFKDRKGPDFVSRLRGYVNIKGPNPEDIDNPESDPAYLIRRAMILRSVLERFYGHLIQDNGRAAVSMAVINGFLREKQFLHGARSLQAVVETSDLGRAQRFGVASLPARDVLSLHVSDASSFMDYVLRGQVEEPVIEALAESCHEAWRGQKEKDGWSYGDPRDDKKMKRPDMRPYAELNEEGKERNRAPARLVQAKLRDIGYNIERIGGGGDKGVADFTEKEKTRLMRIEHDIWLRERLLEGWEWAETNADDVFLHRDIAPFDNVPKEDQELDRAIVDSIPETLRKHGYKLVRESEGA